MITVWVIEDKAESRQTLSFIIEGTSDLRLGKSFENCEDAIDVIKQYKGRAKPEFWPDVILLDVNLPGINGLEGIAILKSSIPNAQIIMLTVRDDADTIYQALKEGASGYLVKGTDIEDIISAIREGAKGGMLIPSPVARKMLHFFQKNTVSVSQYGLTEREIDVLKQMTEGLSQKEIATALYITSSTVNSHIQNVYKKLHVNCAPAAVAKAIREGLIM